MSLKLINHVFPWYDLLWISAIWVTWFFHFRFGKLLYFWREKKFFLIISSDAVKHIFFLFHMQNCSSQLVKVNTCLSFVSSQRYFSWLKNKTLKRAHDSQYSENMYLSFSSLPYHFKVQKISSMYNSQECTLMYTIVPTAIFAIAIFHFQFMILIKMLLS